MSDANKVETAADIGETPADVVIRWTREIKLADQHEKDWRDRAEKIVKLYRDDRPSGSDSETATRFNILFANTEITKSAVYQQAPTPDVRRRFLDKDDVGRTAATVMQRAISACLDQPSYDFHEQIKLAVHDMVLPGRGQVKVRYIPTTDAAGQVVYEEVACQYVDWQMVRYSPAKRWDKVRWISYPELLTREDLRKQFPDVAEKVELSWLPEGKEDTAENELFKRALVHTIWNKQDRRVYVICEGYKDAPLKVEDDPLRLEGFFPSPRPIYDVWSTETMVPVPEYVIYQDQARELDELSERISVLTGALKRRGVYDASQPELEELTKAGDNQFIAVKKYREFAEKGGLEAAFQELPIEAIAKVLLHLMEQAEAKKQAIYELIGLSDIMRGATKATETLGAQELKSQYGSIRIEPRKDEVQRFARDVIRIKAEIIAEHFSPQTLAMMTNVKLPMDEAERQMMMAAVDPLAPPQTPKPTWEEVMALLKSDKLRGFRIDVETDSTVKPQADLEQKNRIELLTATTSFLEKAVPAVAQGFIPADVATEMLMFGVRAFKTGPQLEEALEQWTDSLKNAPPAMPGMPAPGVPGAVPGDPVGAMPPGAMPIDPMAAGMPMPGAMPPMLPGQELMPPVMPPAPPIDVNAIIQQISMGLSMGLQPIIQQATQALEMAAQTQQQRNEDGQRLIVEMLGEQLENAAETIAQGNQQMVPMIQESLAPLLDAVGRLEMAVQELAGMQPDGGVEIVRDRAGVMRALNIGLKNGGVRSQPVKGMQ